MKKEKALKLISLILALAAVTVQGVETNILTQPGAVYPLATSVSTNDDILGIQWIGANWGIKRTKIDTVLQKFGQTFADKTSVAAISNSVVSHDMTLTNLLGDPDALKYATNCATFTDRENVRNFIFALKASNVWSRLTDGYLLGYQVSQSNPVSLRGIVGTNNLGVISQDGITFSNQTGQYAQWAQSFPLSHTVIAVMQNAPLYDDCVAFGLHNSGGITISARLLTFFSSSSSMAQIYEREAASVIAGAMWWDRNGQAVPQIDPRKHSYAYASDNVGNTTVWFDGAATGSHTQAGKIITSSLDRLTLGSWNVSGSYGQPYSGTIETVLVFSGVLTTNEIKAVEVALQWIQRKPVTIHYGDSRTEWRLNETNGYSRKYAASREKTTLIYQEGVSGRTINGLLTGYSDLIAHRKPVNGKAANLDIWGGINSIWLSGVTGEAAWQTASNLVLLAQADGFACSLATEPPPDAASLAGPFPANPWDAGKQTQLDAYNAAILNYGPLLCKGGIFQRHKMFRSMDTNAVPWSKDGVHFKDVGNVMIALELANWSGAGAKYRVVDYIESDIVTAKSFVVSNLTASTGTVTNLTAPTANVTTLTATTGTVTTLQAGTATVTGDGDVNGTLTAGHFYLNSGFFELTNQVVRIGLSSTAPANSSDAGSTGELRLMAGYLYYCIAPNTWRRVALSTF